MPRTWTCLIDLYEVAKDLQKSEKYGLLDEHHEFLEVEFVVGLHVVIGSRRHMFYTVPEGKHAPILADLRSRFPFLYPYLMRWTSAALIRS